MTVQALFLSPSHGLGGGIERYVETLEWALSERGVEHARVDLRHRNDDGRMTAYGHMLARGRHHLRTARVPTQLIVAHRTLLPAASLLGRDRQACGISVVCHGTDVWGERPRLRDGVERRIMRRPGVRVIAVSNFTAGALAGTCQASILPPGLSRVWFQVLVDQANCSQTSHQGVRLITVFRLSDWDGKGLPQLLGAVGALGRADVTVTVCGSGEPPAELQSLLQRYPFCTLLPGLSDRELASQLAAADLFVLATRLQLGRAASGEGFGLVLLEAQVAGTPVVGPAYGGSHDAFIDQVTGVAPADETAEALAKTLDELLGDPERLARMGRRAAEWARDSFSPERYAARVVATLL
jgi:phosphatidylinositol alpha-1,6-mannosyltransferase